MKLQILAHDNLLSNGSKHLSVMLRPQTLFKKEKKRLFGNIHSGIKMEGGKKMQLNLIPPNKRQLNLQLPIKREHNIMQDVQVPGPSRVSGPRLDTSMIREFYESSEDDDMENLYQVDPECLVLTRPDKDMHNRCCGGKAWCIKDICGIICAVLTWLLILYAEFVVMMVMLLPGISTYPIYSYANIIVFQSLAFLAFASHLRTMFTDPGAVPKGNATKEMIKQMSFREGQVIFKCTKCCSIKPERAHHCSVCQRCIRKMDHHCPWVNNCVGENNQKYFVLFTFYIAAISIHAVCLAVYQFVTCIRHEWRDCSAYSPPATVVLLLFLIAEALLFAIFTAVMLGTQLHAIWNDETGIEQLKKEQARWVRKSRWKSIQSVFGRFSILWFSPFTQPSPKTKLESYLYSV